jgi:hypothetical protein
MKRRVPAVVVLGRLVAWGMLVVEVEAAGRRPELQPNDRLPPPC